MGAVTRWFCLTKASASAGTRRIVLAVSTLVLGMLALAAPASATTETFNYTGAAQTWTVPAGVTEATFDLYGAQGGGEATAPSPRDSAAGRRRRFRSPPAPRSRSTSAVRGVPPYGGFNGGGARPASTASAGRVAAAAPRTSASAARRSQTVCSSRAAAGERGRCSLRTQRGRR